MKLKVLVDNNTIIDQYYLGEPAVSYYMEDEGSRLLLDVGYSDVFIRNAEAFGLDLETLDKIVISHGHDDHTRGLKYYFEKEHKKPVTLIAHPDAFKEKISEGLNIGAPILEQELSQKCNLVLTREPMSISPNLIFLGEIPESNDFEGRRAFGEQSGTNGPEPDYLMDDTALVYKSPRGIYIITGCSHSGICNIIEYAKAVCGDSRVLGLIGGLHLFEVTEQAQKTADYLKQHPIKELYPCHCTSFAVKAELHKALPVKEVGVGLELNWE